MKYSFDCSLGYSFGIVVSLSLSFQCKEAEDRDVILRIFLQITNHFAFRIFQLLNCPDFIYKNPLKRCIKQDTLLDFARDDRHGLAKAKTRIKMYFTSTKILVNFVLSQCTLLRQCATLGCG